MKKLVKRWIAGVSAAALLVSAVGFDAFTNVFLRSVSADADRGKTGKSTGFDDLEQDTQKGSSGYVYNTGYGLHTNKTATEATDVKDGRTFDVNLESWYVGENPVDVATILDASGSMAWTVDTLEPLEIDYKALEDIGINNKDALIGLQNQPENGGYLPQNVVDLILRPENTDNSKLSYNGYQYYIYDGRSSASEFVPLGYWDGSTNDPTANTSLIGYYPFDGSLENKAPMKTGGTGTYIMHAEDNGGTFSETATPTKIVLPPVKEDSSIAGDLIVSEMVNTGALLSDVTCSGSFTISLRVKSSFTSSGSTDGYDALPLVYIGKDDGSDYIQLQRQSSAGGDTRKIEIVDESDLKIQSSNKLYTKDGTKDNQHVFGYERWVNVNLVYDADNNLLKLYYNDDKDAGTYADSKLPITSKSYEFSPENYKIIIGGNVNGKSLKVQEDTYITDLCVFNRALSEPEINELNDSTKKIKSPKNLSFYDNLTANYNFDNPSNILENTVKPDSGLTYIQQPTGGSGFGTDPITSSDAAEPTYVDDAASGKNSLNVSATSSIGSVLLDAAPTNDGNFTISFAIKHADKDHQQRNGVAEIMYLGNMDLSKNEYYHIARNWQLEKKEGEEKAEGINDDRHLRFFDKGETGNTDTVRVEKVFPNETEQPWSVITYVVENYKIYAYKEGELAGIYDGSKDGILESLDTDAINIIIAGLKDEYKGSDIYIDDLYVFNDALTAGQVNLYFGKELCDSTTYKVDKTTRETVIDKALYHAKNADGTEFAQINPTLYENTDASARRGWYYVNSHSKWADIEGCLEGGKQYLGLINDPCLAEYPPKSDQIGAKEEESIDEPEGDIRNDNKSVATRPPGAPYADAITSGNDPDKVYDYEGDKERSIQFYVDPAGYLRCFFCTGDRSWKSSKIDGTTYWNYTPRTFCSLVYKKTPYDVDAKTGQATKYEQLNEALNQFYTALANNSDLTNSAIVRFSTNNVGEKLDQLIMKDWTNWSEYYQNLQASEKTGKDEELKAKYMHDLLIPEPGETSTKTTTSAAQKIKEYPYVMTGGTYTWTGLKSFYDNMVNTAGKESGDRVYDIANDARDKYLIIFTDGRDNAIEQTDATNNSHKDNVTQAPEGETANTNSELAGLWADKLKEEGYTIFCVMMAAGSISPTANPDEYNKAFDFLTTLAGGKETEKEIKKVEQQIKELDETDPKYEGNKADLEKQIEKIKAANVIVADPTKEGSTTVEAFQNILKQIQQPRNDYTVQDYIDPRFDLIGKDAESNEVIYHLGAGGEVTFTDTNNTKLSQIQVAVPDGTKATLKSGDKANNIIDNIDKTDIVGLPYTPQDSYMVNRTDSSDMTGDGIGTGYLYYDDVKDMYYLRWTNQIIPMENEVLDTNNTGKKLNVWSATIRLKAKDDFIGGNNILTNGNEAGENLVYSDATIENMDKNPNLYFTADKVAECTDSLTSEVNIPYRDKLERLSGTDRKINAVDAGGVSQAVYGDGIDIPSSGFPRTTVNVRLLKLDAKNLNDVIYMGEVISPTMMLADLENDYMTGSYYLEYLERYAYRVYGEKADNKPLLDLLNEWLKINDTNFTEKTFTIPYMYLPDPEYDDDGKLSKTGEKVVIQNSSGASWVGNNIDFADPNLRDVTGFITYTWKRDDGNHEEQQLMPTGSSDPTEETKYDITKEYVVKNTEQIVYNLQLKFTPLKETKEELKDFKLDQNFIKGEGGEPGDKFFNIGTDGEFAEMTTDLAWSTETAGRADYLKAMVKEVRTYTPHVIYNETTKKWELIGEGKENEALEEYDKIDQTTIDTTKNTVTDSGVYDWNKDYKPVVGNVQLEGGDIATYTSTPENVNFTDAAGGKIEGTTGKAISLAANTTYVKDVVNGAIALELVVDGRYLKGTNPEIDADKTFTFDAVRYYDDMLDPLTYGDNHKLNADTDKTGKKYQLTFTVDEKTLPKEPKDDQLYTVWATLVEIKVDNGSDYISITEKATEANPYLGYTAKDALPIGTYVIQTVPNNETANNSLKNSQFYLGENESSKVYFQYLKLDKNSDSYKYNRFPESVYTVSENAATDANDPEYLIQNGATDNAPKNIAESEREKKTDGTNETQTLTFYLGTVETREINGKNVANTKGYSKDDEDDPDKDYIKDRLGIMLLSTDNNALTISKEVTNTNTETKTYEERPWNFTITLNSEDTDWTSKEAKVKWYKLDEDGNWIVDTSRTDNTITFVPDGGIKYTATIKLKHDEKVVITDLPEGTWQVTETYETLSDTVYTPHNNAIGDENWLYKKSNVTNTHDLQPNSSVDFINEFPYELPSAGGEGIDRYIFFGTMITVASVLLAAMLWHGRRKRRAR